MHQTVKTLAWAVVHGLGTALLIGLLVWQSDTSPEELALLHMLKQPDSVTPAPLLAVAFSGFSHLADVSLSDLRVLQGLGLLVAALCFFDLARSCRVPPVLAGLSGPLLIGVVFAMQPVMSHRSLFLALAGVTLWAITQAVTRETRAHSLLAAAAMALGVLLAPCDGLIVGVGLVIALYVCPGRSDQGRRFDASVITLMTGALLLGLAATVSQIPAQLLLDGSAWMHVNHASEAALLEPGHFKNNLFDWINPNASRNHLFSWYMKTGIGVGMLILTPVTAILAASWMMVIKRQPDAQPEPRFNERQMLWFVSAWALLSGVALAVTPGDILHACGLSAGALLWCLIAAVRWMDEHPEPQLVFIRWLPTGVLGLVAAASWYLPLHAIAR